MRAERKSKIHPIDVHVGEVLRAKRQERGLRQDDLAKAGNISFQQVQKNEKGKNRVSASMLYRFAKAASRCRSPSSFRRLGIGHRIGC